MSETIQENQEKNDHLAQLTACGRYDSIVMFFRSMEEGEKFIDSLLIPYPNWGKKQIYKSGSVVYELSYEFENFQDQNGKHPLHDNLLKYYSNANGGVESYFLSKVEFNKPIGGFDTD